MVKRKEEEKVTAQGVGEQPASGVTESEFDDSPPTEPIPFIKPGDPATPLIIEEEEEEVVPAVFQRAEDSLIRLQAAIRSRPAAKRLEAAADDILSVMNPPLVDFFKERCQQLGAKPWQVVCAIIHRSCELKEIDYYPETYGIQDEAEAAKRIMCRNCAQDIPNARWGQLYCCNKCGSYDQGSKVIPFGLHSEECPIKQTPWLREPRKDKENSATPLQ